jgi:hypothetical protein
MAMRYVKIGKINPNEKGIILDNGKVVMYKTQDGYECMEALGKDFKCLDVFSMGTERDISDVVEQEQPAVVCDEDKTYIAQMFAAHERQGEKIECAHNGNRRVVRKGILEETHYPYNNV